MPETEFPARNGTKHTRCAVAGRRSASRISSAKSAALLMAVEDHTGSAMMSSSNFVLAWRYRVPMAMSARSAICCIVTRADTPQREQFPGRGEDATPLVPLRSLHPDPSLRDAIPRCPPFDNRALLRRGKGHVVTPSCTGRGREHGQPPTRDRHPARSCWADSLLPAAHCWADAGPARRRARPRRRSGLCRRAAGHRPRKGMGSVRSEVCNVVPSDCLMWKDDG